MLINMHLYITLWERIWDCSHCYGCDALVFSLVTLVLFVGEKKKGIQGVRRGLSDATANAMWESLWPRVRKDSYTLQHWHRTACLLSAWLQRKTSLKFGISLPMQQQLMKELITQKYALCFVDSTLTWEIWI